MKPCPRCLKGQMYLDFDRRGYWYTCLQCGHTQDVERFDAVLSSDTEGTLESSLPSDSAASLTGDAILAPSHDQTT